MKPFDANRVDGPTVDRGWRGNTHTRTSTEGWARLRLQALVVKVVDILDFNGSFMNRIRDLVGNNPIMLIVTKVRPWRASAFAVCCPAPPVTTAACFLQPLCGSPLPPP